MRMLLGMLCMTAVAHGESVWDLAKDPRTYWYDHDSVPGAYESSGRLFAVGYNVAGNLDRTGTANNEKPWLHAGGTDNCGPEVYARRMLWVPEGKKIKIWRTRSVMRGGRRNGFQFSRATGTYPVGTVAAEFMYDRNRLFEVRERRKTETGWETDQHEFGEKPVGYVAVSDCTSCHEDIGKHAFQIDAVREWYGTVRGLEKDGPIAFHPWNIRGSGRQGIPLTIRDDVKHLVEVVR